MRAIDPRHWFLAAATSVLACKGPANEAETTDDVGPACEQDGDCPDGQYCVFGECSYNWGEEEGPVYECYSDAECSTPEVCLDHSCVPPPWGQAIECEAPVLDSVPLPELGTALELHFVDVADDGHEALIVLRSDGIATLLSDDSIVTNTWPEPFADPHDLVALDLEPMSPIDVAVFSDRAGVARLGVGDGSGGFAFANEIPGFPAIASAIAFDPDLDGIDTLAAVLASDGHGVLFDDIAGLQSSSALIVDGVTTQVLSGQFEGDATLDLLFSRGGCGGYIYPGPGFEFGSSLTPNALGYPTSGCEWLIGQFIGDDPEQPIELIQLDQGSVLVLWPNDGLDPIYTLLPQFSSSPLRMDLGPLADPYLAMIGSDSLELIWSLFDLPEACHATLPMPGVSAIAAGDRDGDGIDQLATLDAEGNVSLHGLIPAG